MNSFNHYAYGAIGDWVYSVAAGLSEDAAKPGYQHVIFQPHPDTSLTYAKAGFESLYGKITSGWRLENDSLFVQVSLPPNTTGTLHLPQPDGKTKTMELGSGTYAYSLAWKMGSAMNTSSLESANTFSTNSNFGALWKNETTKAVLIKHIPELASAPRDQLEQGFQLSLKEISEYVPDVFTKEKMERIDKDLRGLK